jgi:hypothetical protein
MKLLKGMDRTQINNIIQDSVDSLFRSELISEKITINNETTLLGRGSVLDSVAFITLFSEIEDRLSTITESDVIIDYNQLHDYNTDKSSLNVSILCDFILNRLLPNISA